MPEQRNDPYPVFNFTVEIGGTEARAGFTEVELPTAEIEAIDYREGSDRQPQPRHLPGLTKFGRLVLRRGFTGDSTLFQWWKTASQGAQAKQDVIVTLFDESRQPVARWRIRNALPVKYEGPSLNGCASDVAMETLELAVEDVELE
jgi:phage tail-like protein